MINSKIFKIKQNSNIPPLQVNIDTVGFLGKKMGYNLSGVTGITFTMVDECLNCKIYKQPSDVVCENNGIIKYSWKKGDTDKQGFYYGEFHLNFSGGSNFIFPTQGGIKIEITNPIDNFV